MKLGFTAAEERFRGEAAAWLEGQMSGPFRDLRGVTSLSARLERRMQWERARRRPLLLHRLAGEFGGRNATLAEQVVFAEEYARAGIGPHRAHGHQQPADPYLWQRRAKRALPRSRGARNSGARVGQPNAGSDLANVRTRAVLSADGQGGAAERAEDLDLTRAVRRLGLCAVPYGGGSRGHRGLSYLLVPMRQSGVTVRPIRQMTGEAEFNETYFVDARTAVDNVVGAVGDGWRVAMGTLAFERGVSTLGQQMGFRNELDAIIAAARHNGLIADPLIRQRLAHAHIGLKLMRYSALRMLSQAEAGRLASEAYTYKIFWASWRKKLGELALDVLGPTGEIARAAPYEWDVLPGLFLGSRADTIYGGTNQIQRNIIAERALGLPKEPRGA
jgi:alkylation response protein AidB-like acyl-CoA dehydrogenase